MGEDDGKCKPILIHKDKRSKRCAATFVEHKGDNPYAVKFMTQFLQSTGYRNVVNKSDGEPAIVAVKTKAAAAANIDAIPQESPPEDHQANGEIEAMCREIKKGIRCLKIDLERKLGKHLEESDPVLAWMPRHAADLINRYRRGDDGKTPEERRLGKAWRKP